MYKDLENHLNTLKLLYSVKKEDDQQKEIDKTIKSLENKLSGLKN